jgi:hypothetical protein
MNRIYLKLAQLGSWACVALAAAGLFSSGTVRAFAQGSDPALLPVVSLVPVASETTEPSITSKIAPARFLIQRKGDLSQTLHLFLQYAGTATPGKDYVEPDSVVELAAGAASLEVIVSPLDDDLVEGPETVVVRLIDPLTDSIPNYRIDRTADIVRLLIRDNEDPGTLRPPVVGLETLVATTSEPNPLALIAPGTVKLNRAGSTVDALRVGLLAQGTATPGKDYEIRIRGLEKPLEFSANGTTIVPVPAGETAVTLLILGLADEWVEGNETIGLTLLPSLDMTPTGAYLIDAQASAARLILRDEDVSLSPSLEITQPKEGQSFAEGTPIEIKATAVDPRGYIAHLDFYADGRKIGESILNFLVAPAPGTPIHHAFTWMKVPAGTHVLTVQAPLPEGGVIESKPVSIVVVPEPILPVVSISHIQTREAIPDADYAPGHFLVERTGPTEQLLGVYVKKGGTAIAGVDYRDFSELIWISPGEQSVAIKIEAIDDKLPEGQETVSLTLVQPSSDATGPVLPRYRINPDQASARQLMYDNDRASTIASLKLMSPADGEQFGWGSEIRIVVVAIDSQADIRKVEFFDGNTSIGISEHLTKDAIIPGRPREHVLIWKAASVGTHEIWACALDSEGATVLSNSVKIRVTELPPRVSLAVVAKDPVAAENGVGGEAPDPAVFSIRRVSGPRDVEVLVHYALGGVAENGVDYERLSGRVLLPSGAESVDVVLTPIPDKAIEGDEGVVLELMPPACIAIFPPPPQCYLIVGDGAARAVIQDGNVSENLPPRIAITKPSSGDSFEFDQNIQLVAEGQDPDGFIRRVEFYSGRVKIGEVGVDRPNPSNQPRVQVFRLVWKDAEPGKHSLTARATDNQGAISISAAVEISVSADHPRPIVTVVEWDPHAVEPRNPGELNTASFQVRRSGSTADPLLVFYALEGTATEGKDYEALPRQVIIPSGRSSVFVTITPVDDSERERTESVVFRVVESPVAGPVPPYTVGRPATARAVIADAGWILPLGEAHCVELPGGLTHLCFAGADGSRFRVEASDDLLIWETVLHATAIDGACHFVDETIPGRSRRFYRAVPLPASEDPSAP